MTNTNGIDRVAILINWMIANKDMWRKLLDIHPHARIVPEEYARCLEDLKNLGLYETVAIIIQLQHEDFSIGELMDDYALDHVTSIWSTETARKIFKYAKDTALEKGRKLRADPALRVAYYDEDWRDKT